MGRPGPLTPSERPEARLTLRPATSADEALLLAWRNDPEAVRFSVTGRSVTPDEHATWLARRLDDPTTRLWIADEDGRPVGQVRVDADDSTGLVSIAIAPDERGRGLGVAALRAMVVEVERHQTVRTLRALVHAENPGSLRAFERAGFSQLSTRDGEFVVLECAVGTNAHSDPLNR